MKRNKLLAVAFGIILILSVLPAVAGCKDNIGDTGAAAYTYSKLVYSVKNDGVHILGYNGQESSVIFPNTIEGREVVSVESVSSKTLVSITLPSSVKKIESKAFKNCLALENINILSEDIIIADDAFAYFEEKQTELRPQMMSTFTATAEDSDTDKKIIFVTFSVSSENVIEDNAILNDNNTIILNTAQKSLLQKFIDTGHLQKYRILRNSSADNSVLEVDGNYIYYDKKVNNQSVYTETFTGNMSYMPYAPAPHMLRGLYIISVEDLDDEPAIVYSFKSSAGSIAQLVYIFLIRTKNSKLRLFTVETSFPFALCEYLDGNHMNYGQLNDLKDVPKRIKAVLKGNNG